MQPWFGNLIDGVRGLVQALARPASTAPACCECGTEEGRLYTMSCCGRKYCTDCGTSHLIESARGRLFACACGECTVIE